MSQLSNMFGADLFKNTFEPTSAMTHTRTHTRTHTHTYSHTHTHTHTHIHSHTYTCMHANTIHLYSYSWNSSEYCNKFSFAPFCLFGLGDWGRGFGVLSRVSLIIWKLSLKESRHRVDFYRPARHLAVLTEAVARQTTLRYHGNRAVGGVRRIRPASSWQRSSGKAKKQIEERWTNCRRK